MRSTFLLAAALVLLPLAAQAATPMPAVPVGSVEASRFDAHFVTMTNTGDSMSLIPVQGLAYDIVVCSLSRPNVVVRIGTSDIHITEKTCGVFFGVTQASLQSASPEQLVEIFFRLSRN